MKRFYIIAAALWLLLADVAAGQSEVYTLEHAGLDVAVKATARDITLYVALTSDGGASQIQTALRPLTAPHATKVLSVSLTARETLQLAKYLRDGNPVDLPLRVIEPGVLILGRDTDDSVTLLFSSVYLLAPTGSASVIIARLTTDEAEFLAGLLEAGVDELLGI
mgnify:CR=1 FL=1